MIKSWWNGLNARERTLILVASGLALVFAFFQFGLLASMDARARAERAYLNAHDVLNEVRIGAAMARDAGAGSTQNAASGGSIRAAVTNTAARSKLSISRMQPIEDGGLTITLDEVDGAALFQWLARLRADHGVVVTRAAVSRNSGRPTVRANIVLTPGGGPT